jgi:hypothetical protein
MWTLADLFLVGLVLDISGAVLLAKGLLLSPRALSKLNTYWGLEQGQQRDRVDNRVAGEFGVAYLVLGFVLQFVGYSLDIGGVRTKAGGERLGVALGMATVALVISVCVWRVFSLRRVESLNAAIERAGPEASKEIGEEEYRKKTAGEESAQ